MRLTHVAAAARLVLAIGPRAERALNLPDDELRAALAFARARPDLVRRPDITRLLPHLGGAAFLRSLIPPRVRPAPPAPPPVRLAALTEAPEDYTDGLGGGAWSYSHAKRHGIHTVRRQCDADDAAADRLRVLRARERRDPTPRGVCEPLPPPPPPEPIDPDVLRAEAQRERAARLEAVRGGGRPVIVLRDPKLMPDPKKLEMRPRPERTTR